MAGFGVPLTADDARLLMLDHLCHSFGPMKGTEALRKKHKPNDVRVLFVGESPPAGGTFFYAANSKLYFATQEAFVAVMPKLRGKHFVDAFQDLGCYLDDLCLEPVNDLSESEKRTKRKEGEALLARRMKKLSPRAIVVVLVGIEQNVRRAAREAGHADVPLYALPFPASGTDSGTSRNLLTWFERSTRRASSTVEGDRSG